MTRDDLLKKLMAAGIAFGMLNEVQDLAEHPHLRAVKAYASEQEISLPASAIRWEHDDVNEKSRAPLVDEHGSSIRKEFGHE
jgi:itaconate CoA-transferase